MRGRDRELTFLQKAVAARRPVVVVGEPGIGKTTILEALVALFPSRARLVRCLRAFRWRPYLPFAVQVGSIPADPQAAFLAVRQWLGTDGVLLIDDLSFADDHSLALVARLATFVTVIAATRDDVDAEPCIVAAGLADAPHVPLQGLPDDEIEAIAVASHPEVTLTQRRHLVASARGNPLYVAEGVASEPFAASLRTRIRELSPTARRTHALLSVAGRPLDPQVLPGGVDELIRHRLAVVVAEEQVAVRHELIAEATRSTLTAAETADVSRELASLVVDPTERCRLYELAGERTLAYEMATAATPSAHGAERASLLVSAARNAPADEQPATTLLAARELIDIGDPRSALTLIDFVAEARRLPELEVEWARASWDIGDVADAVARAERVYDVVRDTGTEVEVAALEILALPFLWSWDLDGAEPYVARAEEISRVTNTGSDVSLVLRATSDFLVGHGEKTTRSALRAYQGLSAAARPREVLRAAGLYGVCLLQRGEPAAAQALLEPLISEYRASGREGAATYLEVVLLGFLLSGQWDSRRAARLEWLIEMNPFHETATSRQTLSIIYAHRGQTADAARLTNATSLTVDQAAFVELARRELALAEGRLSDAVAPVEPSQPLIHVLLQSEVRAWAAFRLGQTIEIATPYDPNWFPYQRARASTTRALASGPPTSGSIELLMAAADDHASALEPGYAARAIWGAGELARRLADGRASVLLERAQREAVDLELAVVERLARQSLRLLGTRPRPNAIPGAGKSRELEVLELVRDGHTSKEIAARLAISPRTVDTTIRNVMRRLGSRTRHQAAASVLEDGSNSPPMQPVEVVPAGQAHRSGDVLKLSDGPEIVLRIAARGDAIVVQLTGHPAIDDPFLDDLRRVRPIRFASRSSVRNSRAERVAELRAQGMSNREIAGALHVSVRTVERELAAFRRAHT